MGWEREEKRYCHAGISLSRLFSCTSFSLSTTASHQLYNKPCSRLVVKNFVSIETPWKPRMFNQMVNNSCRRFRGPFLAYGMHGTWTEVQQDCCLQEEEMEGKTCLLCLLIYSKVNIGKNVWLCPLSFLYCRYLPSIHCCFWNMLLLRRELFRYTVIIQKRTALSISVLVVIIIIIKLQDWKGYYGSSSRFCTSDVSQLDTAIHTIVLMSA